VFFSTVGTNVKNAGRTPSGEKKRKEMRKRKKAKTLGAWEEEERREN